MKHKFATANGLKFCYDEFGAPDRPAMLLIMGLGTQMIAWPEPFCERLADEPRR
jgi:pimeloyl-ACP methyl ester carboxylesterase